MSAVVLSENQKVKILEFLYNNPHVHTGDESACLLFIEAVPWMARSGSQWRLLPGKYGKWNSVYRRFARWSIRGVWERLHLFCAGEHATRAVQF